MSSIFSLQLSQLVKARKEMDDVLAKLQKENPSERILFNEDDMENLSLDKK